MPYSMRLAAKQSERTCSTTYWSEPGFCDSELLHRPAVVAGLDSGCERLRAAGRKQRPARCRDMVLMAIFVILQR